MTQAAATRPGVTGYLLCCCPVEAAEPRCPAFALARISAHAGGCGGCTSGPARPAPPADPSEAAA
jgi:hypothetical protein